MSEQELFVSPHARRGCTSRSCRLKHASSAGHFLARRFEMSPEWHPRERDISERCRISIYAARKALIDLRPKSVRGQEPRKEAGKEPMCVRPEHHFGYKHTCEYV